MTEKVNTRDLVVDILLSVTRDGEFSHIAVRNVLDKYRYLPRQERAFISRLSMGTLERMTELDYIINQFSKTKVTKMKPVIRAILRSGVYQLKYMSSVPASAACNEAVKLAVKRGFGGLKGFVNGIMRNISRNLDHIVFPDMEREPVKALSVCYSMPEWLVKRFYDQFGKERSVHILSAFLEQRPISVRVDTDRISVEEVQKSLERQGVRSQINDKISCGLFLSGYDTLEEIEEFEKGLLYAQDTASMMVAELADPQEGDFVLDVCAAPGGKSVHMAQKLKGTGMVEARDLTDYKVALIEENIERCRLHNMRAKVWDARVFDEDLEQKADIVLADLPCSGLGVIGTKPDIKYNASEEKIRKLRDLQREILTVTSRYVKKGGLLVYSTCTVTPEENEENAAWFADAYPEFEAEFQRQTLPDEGCDGFFIAGFRRT